MKRIACICCIVILWAHSVHAMDLDVLKRHFLKSEWKSGIKEGEALLAKAQRNTDGLDELYYYLALCYVKDGNYLRASDICEIILREFPRTKFREQAQYVLIEAYDRHDDVAEARKQAQEFIRKYPASAHRKDVEARLTRLNQRQAAQATRAVITPAVSAPRVAAPASIVAAPVIVPYEPQPAAHEIDIVLAPGVQQVATPEKSARQFWVQVGAFSNNRNAGNLAQKLRAASYRASVIKSTLKGKDVFKVRVGPYYTNEEVSSASKKLSRAGYPTKVIP